MTEISNESRLKTILLTQGKKRKTRDFGLPLYKKGYSIMLAFGPAE